MNYPVFEKAKIFNDPIYGFIAIPKGIVFELIEHAYFQRLRRITQLGLSQLVYSGAYHTRFHHAIGAMHLMRKALTTLISKGANITSEEFEAALIAILLHDIGHGPYSHALEFSLVENIKHEELSLLFMQKLNEQFNGKLTTAIDIFTGKHPKKFLSQLVSSQLDVDRMDYLNRDSFYSGVSEGVIGTERIVSMLTIHNNELAVESKAIYSIEKFLVARRIMYWQVYLHKTAVAAEKLLINILRRAKYLSQQGIPLFSTSNLAYFIEKNPTLNDFQNHDALEHFARLDDFDIIASIKEWCYHEDEILSFLSQSLLNRRLYKLEVQNHPFSETTIQKIKETIRAKRNIGEEDLSYFTGYGKLTNRAYNPKAGNINIVFKNGQVKDITEAADLLNISEMSKEVEKYYLFYPKE